MFPINRLIYQKLGLIVWGGAERRALPVHPAPLAAQRNQGFPRMIQIHPANPLFDKDLFDLLRFVRCLGEADSFFLSQRRKGAKVWSSSQACAAADRYAIRKGLRGGWALLSSAADFNSSLLVLHSSLNSSRWRRCVTPAGLPKLPIAEGDSA
jgi:hypothetical protein